LYVAVTFPVFFNVVENVVILPAASVRLAALGVKVGVVYPRTSGIIAVSAARTWELYGNMTFAIRPTLAGGVVALPGVDGLMNDTEGSK
jgi:hypothetical protein